MLLWCFSQLYLRLKMFVKKLWILKFNLSNEYTKERLNKMSNNSNCTLQNHIAEVFCSIFRFNNSSHELTGLHGIIQNVIKYTCIQWRGKSFGNIWKRRKVPMVSTHLKLTVLVKKQIYKYVLKNIQIIPSIRPK